MAVEGGGFLSMGDAAIDSDNVVQVAEGGAGSGPGGGGYGGGGGGGLGRTAALQLQLGGDSNFVNAGSSSGGPASPAMPTLAAKLPLRTPHTVISLFSDTSEDFAMFASQPQTPAQGVPASQAQVGTRW